MKCKGVWEYLSFFVDHHYDITWTIQKGKMLCCSPHLHHSLDFYFVSLTLSHNCTMALWAFSLLTFFYYPFAAQSKQQNKTLVPSRNFSHINHTPLHWIKNTSKVEAKNYGREKKRECDNGGQKSPICLLSLSLPTFSFLQILSP